MKVARWLAAGCSERLVAAGTQLYVATQILYAVIRLNTGRFTANSGGYHNGKTDDGSKKVIDS